MKEIVENYIQISRKIINILNENEVDYDKLEKYLNQRDYVIKKINEKNKIKEFRKIYINDLHEVDIEIKELIKVNLSKAKSEIIEYRKRKTVNTVYTNMNKSNFNIFLKKV